MTAQNRINGCCGCGQELTTVTFADGVCLICLNWRCRLYRRPQQSEPRVKIRGVGKPPGEFKDWETYRKFRQRNSRNYHSLKNLGFPTKFCKTHQSSAAARRIIGMVNRGLSVEGIIKLVSGGRHG
jgi:hypothetical protein